MSKSKKTTRKCSFQSLENRQMMAGDMVAYTYNGDLYVHESPSSSQISQDNHVQISRSQAGTIKITGAKNADGTTTLIGNGFNSNFSSFKTFNGNSIRDIYITTGGGNDQVEMMPGGDYRLNNVTIDTSGPSPRDADQVFLDDTIFRKNLAVYTGGGDDLVDMQLIRTTGTMNIRTGAGADNVIVKRSSISGNFNRIDTFDYENEIDRDNVLLEDLFVNRLGVDTGGGDDTITVRRHTANAALPSFINIGSGAGHDTVTLQGVNVDEVYAYLGAGRDLLDLSGVKTKAGVRVSADPETGAKEFDTVRRPGSVTPIDMNQLHSLSSGVDQLSYWSTPFIGTTSGKTGIGTIRTGSALR